nr:probable cytochrome P450 513F1 isoform X1 [Onthophagus taurus]
MNIPLFLVVIFLTLIFIFKIYWKKFGDIHKIPGPSIFDFIKHVYFNKSSQGVIKYFQTLNKKYGPVVKIWMHPLKPIIITTDMEYVNKIYKANDHRITPCFSEITFLRKGFTVTPHYDIWKHDKHLIMKTFDKEYISNKLKKYEKKYDELINKIHQNQGTPIDLQEAFNEMFIEIIMRSLNDSNIELTDKEIKDYLNYRTIYFDLLLEKMNSLHMVGFLHKFTKNYKLLMEYGEKIVQFGQIWLKRLQNVDEKLRDQTNVVYAMLNGGIPFERVVDNMSVLIQGGHDTGIFPLSLALQEIAKNVELQEKILNEILSVLGPDKTSITLDDINKMYYIHAVMKESLRRYHSLPFLDRKLLYDMTIKNVKIPKDTIVMFNFPGIMTSEENYEDPLKFKPERFLKGNVTSKAHKGFIGFGYGVKICAGKHYLSTWCTVFIKKLYGQKIYIGVSDHTICFVIIYHNTRNITLCHIKKLLYNNSSSFFSGYRFCNGTIKILKYDKDKHG